VKQGLNQVKKDRNFTGEQAPVKLAKPKSTVLFVKHHSLNET
jgi:hypothetical protein